MQPCSRDWPWRHTSRARRRRPVPTPGGHDPGRHSLPHVSALVPAAEFVRGLEIREKEAWATTNVCRRVSRARPETTRHKFVEESILRGLFKQMAAANPFDRTLSQLAIGGAATPFKFYDLNKLEDARLCTTWGR